MTRNMKDKMWIFSDKKLLTTEKKAKGTADRFSFQIQIHSRFPDSGGPPVFVLPGYIESALLCSIVYREGFSSLSKNHKHVS